MTDVGKWNRCFNGIKDDMANCTESIDGSEASTI